MPAVVTHCSCGAGQSESGFVRHAYRPFDNRWLYWEAETKLLDEKRTDYKPHVFAGNKWISFNKRPQKGESEPRACATEHIGCHDLIGNATCFFSLWLYDYAPSFREHELPHRPNLTPAAMRYLELLGARIEDLFFHVLAALHDPAYRHANAGALKMGWPRIPLPGWAHGDAAGAAEALAESAARGRKLAQLLDSDTPVPGITEGALRPEAAAIAVPATTDGRNMAGDDFALTAGWGHFGSGGAVMPGQGRIVQRAYTPEERAASAGVTPILGETTYDIYLNARAYWRNVPAGVWTYKLGGYQVLKKWLSYRERTILRRPLKPDEVQHFAETARRIAGILLLTHQKTP